MTHSFSYEMTLTKGVDERTLATTLDDLKRHRRKFFITRD